VLQFPLYHPINPEFRPNVDGRVIVDKPKRLFALGQFARVPFIIGTVRDEFGNNCCPVAIQTACVLLYSTTVRRWLQLRFHFHSTVISLPSVSHGVKSHCDDS